MSEENSAIKNLTADIERRLRIKDRQLNTTETELKIGCVNVRSLLAEKGKRQKNINRVIVDRHFDIFILQKTWLSESKNQNVPSEFFWARNDKKFATGETCGHYVWINTTDRGGQLIYVRQGIEWEIKSEGEFGNTNVQYLHIEITQPVQLHLIAVYSPPRPNNYKLVYTLMSWYIAALPAGARVMFIGDVNINWFKRTPFQCVFSDTLEARGIHQLIQSVTRPVSGKCLDHIYTNVKVKESKTKDYVIEKKSILADHLLIYCIISHSGESESGSESASGSVTESVSEREKTIGWSGVFMLCKLVKYYHYDREFKLAENEVGGGYLVLLALPTETKTIAWVNEIHRTNTIQWCNIFYATYDMVAQLRNQLPVVDFKLYPN